MIPVPIIIPYSAHKDEPDYKCPKCGHEWNEKSVPMSLPQRVIVTIIVIVGLYFLVGLFDIFSGGIMYNTVFVRTVDYYEVPDGWEILSNSKGRKIIKTGDYYLTRANDVKLSLEKYPDIHPPLKCVSEIRAKSTLKHYLDRKKLVEFK